MHVRCQCPCPPLKSPARFAHACGSCTQHDDTPYNARDVAAFKDVVQASSGGTVVVMDPSRANPATRAWCTYEWWGGRGGWARACARTRACCTRARAVR